MQTVKNRDEFFNRDPCHEFFSMLTLEHLYAMLPHFELHDGVPEDVRSYMATVITLWLYGWLYYPFYTVAAVLSTMAVEMALKLRFPEKKQSTLALLLQFARQAGLLKDEGFPSLKHRRENSEMIARGIEPMMPGGTVPEPEGSFTDRVVGRLPRVRNDFAHPDMHTIVAPGMAADILNLAAEVINQLWPPAASAQRSPSG